MFGRSSDEVFFSLQCLVETLVSCHLLKRQKPVSLRPCVYGGDNRDEDGG